MERGHGDRPQWPIRHEDQGFDPGGFEIGLEGPHQPGVQLLGVWQIFPRRPLLEPPTELPHLLGEPVDPDRNRHALQARRQADQELDPIRKENWVHDHRRLRDDVELRDLGERRVHAVVPEVVPQLGHLEQFDGLPRLDQVRRDLGGGPYGPCPLEEQVHELEVDRPDRL